MIKLPARVAACAFVGMAAETAHILKVGDSVSIQVGQGLLITADKP
jgi:hypothetical protein